MGSSCWRFRCGCDARELQVATRWYDALRQAPDHEAVVYHPCFDSPEARSLIAAGARVNSTDYTGRSALEHARAFRHRQVVDLLQESGAED